MDMLKGKEFWIGVAVGYLVLGKILKVARETMDKAKAGAPAVGA